MEPRGQLYRKTKKFEAFGRFSEKQHHWRWMLEFAGQGDFTIQKIYGPETVIAVPAQPRWINIINLDAVLIALSLWCNMGIIIPL